MRMCMHEAHRERHSAWSSTLEDQLKLDGAIFVEANPKVIAILAHPRLDVFESARKPAVGRNLAVRMAALVLRDGKLILPLIGARRCERRGIHLARRALEKAHSDLAWSGRRSSIAV